MRKVMLSVCVPALVLGACSGLSTDRSTRGAFDTSMGVAGTNEFHAGDSESTVPSAATPVGPPLAKLAPGATPPEPAAETHIRIDANAFAAVFGADAASVRPTATQLMQLDSLSLVAADNARADLQQKILACRRAGDACRLAGQ